MALLAILQPDARGAARLTDALGGAHELVVHASWAALEAGMVEGAFAACLVDADHPDRDAAVGRLARLRTRFPDLAIIACVESAQGPGFYGLGELGLAGVVITGSQPARFRTEMDLALRAVRAQQVERMLAGRVGASGTAAITWATENAGTNPTVERLAAALGHSPGSLRDELHDLGLPTPARVLLWGRLLLAGARLGDDDRRAEDVAFSLGYSTTTSLSRAMKQHTGLSPAEVSRLGGMSVVLEALLPPGVETDARIQAGQR